MHKGGASGSCAASRAAARSRSACSTAVTVPRDGPRAPSHSRTRPDTAVGAFGSARMRVAVVAAPSRPSAMSSAAAMSRAAVRRRARRAAPCRRDPRSRDLDLEPQPRRERRHRGGRRARSVQRSALVGVQLEEPREVTEVRRRLGQPVGIDAGLAQRIAQRDAVVVAAGQRIGDVEPPDQSAAAEGRRVEPSALLVGVREDGNRPRAALGNREGRDDVERPVEAPARPHAVQMGPQGPPRRRRVRDRPAVAREVPLEAQAGARRAALEPRAERPRPRGSTPAG